VRVGRVVQKLKCRTHRRILISKIFFSFLGRKVSQLGPYVYMKRIVYVSKRRFLVQLVSLIHIFVRDLFNFLLVPQLSVPQPLEFVFMGRGGKLCNYRSRLTPY
jgi:hypothetical protein